MNDFKENILHKVRVLIIDDSEFKYTQIKDSLNRLISPQITWCKSRNSGLALILKHNVKQVFEPSSSYFEEVKELLSPEE